MSRSLFWFRRDLRIDDNVGLVSARRDSDELLGLFVVDDNHDNWPHRNGDRLQFKLDGVKNLRDAIQSADGELYVRIGRPSSVVSNFCRTHDITKIYWNRCYEPYERARDKQTRSDLEKMGVEVKTHKDQVVHERREILTQDETPYRVFSYYADSWRNQPHPSSVETVDKLDSMPGADPGRIPTVDDLGLKRALEDRRWTPSPAAAKNRWQSFLTENLLDYKQDRNYPARGATSRLSPHLRFGFISVRRLLEDCRKMFRDVPNPEGIRHFVDELIWRDFYHQILYNHPRVAEENFRSKYDALEWESHPDWLEAWKAGRTGIPIVDAAMRQLNRTGWMHNRLRMIVASFLTKDCFIHWRKGEKYFMNRLLDGDTAANNGGWQWAASTGTDAVPYFRIFNPYSQSKSYDPEGAFIRRYCPELKGLDSTLIHAPHRADPSVLNEAGVSLGKTYPEPILSHSERRKIALQKFNALDDG